jgi:hypothetical protein
LEKRIPGEKLFKWDPDSKKDINIVMSFSHNVLIDVLCGVMVEKEPLGIVRFMWSLLWCKTLVFCVGGADEGMSLTGY